MLPSMPVASRTSALHRMGLLLALVPACGAPNHELFEAWPSGNDMNPVKVPIATADAGGVRRDGGLGHAVPDAGLDAGDFADPVLDPTVSFVWKPKSTNAVICKAGSYAGNFQCTRSDQNATLVSGQVSITVVPLPEAQQLSVMDGLLRDFAGGLVFNARVLGTIDCSADTFTGVTVDGMGVESTDAGSSFVSFDATFDGGLSPGGCSGRPQCFEGTISIVDKFGVTCSGTFFFSAL